MTSEESVVDWDDILEKLSSYKGTIKGFCKENNISIHQLYYRRKKLKENNTSVFHAVDIKEKDQEKAIKEQPMPSRSCLSSNVKIEIGKAKMYIPSNEVISLSNILKVIIQLC